MPEKKKDARIVKTYEFPTKPEKKTLGQILYDKETGQVFGRTAKSWGQLFVFYMIFYALLAALFTICMQALLATMNTQFPKWQLDASIIGTSPGVGYRPMATDSDTENIIRYTAANKSDVQQWVSRIDDFLTPYKDISKLIGNGKNQVICDVNSPPTGGNVCAFDTSKLGPCSSEQGYSYNKSAPCMFIKLNRIYGWVPELYDDVNDLPSDMPTDLVEHIKSLPENERKQIWVSCNGLTAADAETIGPLKYFPARGLPSYYYPYTNKPGYLSPLVAVHFARPTVKENINVECRVWAKNVIYRGGHRDRRGSLHVVLRIE
ncbi:sodium/potassium-transporting ATPase subunit beta-2-like [Toxorhynchites rutilus septentrionalis]|uniref:sodium/potassium-transporting ATPase subunit beta-2-like n=1 Tax=Toxorhynchites rutilus septentrionalis TaxID=329112 RepID=UPI002479239E|nr:sodium/potassium-transporting ATPase subunit beta-2-like [Toxorhynchites rutilus septentrionalis]